MPQAHSRRCRQESRAAHSWGECSKISSSWCCICSLSLLGIELVTSCSLWSAATCPCDGVGQWKSRSFCLWLLYDLENLLVLKFSRSWPTSAFIHGAVVLFGPWVSHCPQRCPRCGAGSYGMFQGKTMTMEWVCIHICFALHLDWVLVSSSSEFLRKLNLRKEPPSGLPKSHVTLSRGWSPD